MVFVRKNEANLKKDRERGREKALLWEFTLDEAGCVIWGQMIKGLRFLMSDKYRYVEVQDEGMAL